MPIWNTSRETLSRDEMSALQSEQLRKQVAYAYTNVAPYRTKMDAAGITPGDIQSIDDLWKLPFTLKTDLRDSYPYGMFATPMSEVVRIHASSGTTGKQTVVGYSKADIALWNECMARSMSMAGVTAEDVVHVSYGYGLFTGGLGGHYGGETIGAATIPASTGNTKRQLQMFEDFGSTVLLCTPSYAVYLGEAVQKAGLADKIKLKIGLFGAEPWTEGMREQIEKSLGVKAYDIYGLSEISGPGVACECSERCGLHTQEDHFYVEVVDPETGRPVPNGQSGELVFTCLTKETMPLIRYNTRDIATIDRAPCACGRTTTRIGKITGRTDDMLIIRGVNVFPSQVESVLMQFAELSPHYLITIDRVGALDTVEITVELLSLPDEIRAIEEFERKIAREMLSTLGISTDIRLVAPGKVPRSEGKAVRVQDKRTH